MRPGRQRSRGLGPQAARADATATGVAVGRSARLMRIRRTLLRTAALVLLVGAVASLVLTGDLWATGTLALVLAAVGAALPRRREVWTVQAVGCLAWLTVVRVEDLGPSSELGHAAVQLATAVALGVALHELRRGVQGGLERDRVALTASEERLRTIFTHSPVGMTMTDDQGRIIAANPAYGTFLGRALAEIIGHVHAEFTHPDDLALPTARAAVAASPNGIAQFRKRFVRPDGTVRTAGLTATSITGPDGARLTLAHLQDVTERDRAERELRRSRAELSAIAAILRCVQAGRDARDTVLAGVCDLANASSAYLLELGHGGLVVTASTRPALVGTLVDPDEPSASATVFRTGVPLLLSDPQASAVASRRLHALSDTRSLLFHPVRAGDATLGVLVAGWDDRIGDADEIAVRSVALLADEAGVALTQEAMREEVTRLALTDALTGVPNRRGWDQAYGRLLEASTGSGAPLTVAVADLDHFKDFNDRHGHDAGDDLLRHFARAARAALRDQDVLARWGGEEFAVALPDCAADEAHVVLHRLRAAVPRAATCSIGYATWDGAESGEDLLRRADVAMYAAKARGRDAVVAA